MRNKLEFDFYALTGTSNCPYPALASTPHQFELTVPNDTKPMSRMTWNNFPEIKEIYHWCVETFGEEHKDWCQACYISFETHSRTGRVGGRVAVRPASIQYHFKNTKMLALFKLRWS